MWRCEQIKGISQECRKSLGGLRKVWLASWTPDAFQFANDNMTVTGINTDIEWQKYEFSPNQANVKQKFVNDLIENNLYMRFNLQDSPKLIEANALLREPVLAIVRDRNNMYKYFGSEEGMIIKDTSTDTGNDFKDGNYIDITLYNITTKYEGFLGQAAIDYIEGLDTENNFWLNPNRINADSSGIVGAESQITVQGTIGALTATADVPWLQNIQIIP